jgi:hypothetical protein
LDRAEYKRMTNGGEVSPSASLSARNSSGLAPLLWLGQTVPTHDTYRQVGARPWLGRNNLQSVVEAAK